MITLRFKKQDALDALDDILNTMRTDGIDSSATCRSVQCIYKPAGIVVSIYKRADITTQPHPVFDDDELPF